MGSMVTLLCHLWYVVLHSEVERCINLPPMVVGLVQQVRKEDPVTTIHANHLVLWDPGLHGDNVLFFVVVDNNPVCYH